MKHIAVALDLPTLNLILDYVHTNRANGEYYGVREHYWKHVENLSVELEKAKEKLKVTQVKGILSTVSKD